MKNSIEKAFALHRPKGFSGKADQYLPQIIKELKQLLYKIQKKLKYDTCHLAEQQRDALAVILVEFAEDIHNDIGLWYSLEYYNNKLLGLKLPLTTSIKKNVFGFDPLRIEHLLWKVWQAFEPELILAPKHVDLLQIAQDVSEFLTKRFKQVPKGSGIKKFLLRSNRYGWEVKKKLIWVGIHSYLFRHFFENYSSGIIPTIGTIDDFICQECTIWTGLGAIDILAQTLKLPEDDQIILRNWYQRHTALYKILSRQDRGRETKTLKALNLVNNKNYNIRMNMLDCPFKPNHLVHGGLVQWKNQWYWSGEQKKWDTLPDETIKNMCKDFLEKLSSISYRYCPELAEKAKDKVHIHHKEFLAQYGNDLVIYPDGLSAAAQMQKNLREKFQSVPTVRMKQIMRMYNLSKPEPKMEFPQEFLDCQEGIGVFSNPEEGVEIMSFFHLVLTGLKKKGIGVNDDEASTIRGFIQSPAISPAFVHRVVKEYGVQSIADAYMIRDFHTKTDLEYLLHCYKGHFYRKRYPPLSIAQEDF